MMRSGSALAPTSMPGRNRCSGGGNFEFAATNVPFGAAGRLVGSFPVRANASNRIGAAAARP